MFTISNRITSLEQHSWFHEIGSDSVSPWWSKMWSWLLKIFFVFPLECTGPFTSKNKTCARSQPSVPWLAGLFSVSLMRDVLVSRGERAIAAPAVMRSDCCHEGYRVGPLGCLSFRFGFWFFITNLNLIY